MKEYFSDYPDFFNEELRPHNLDNILNELKSKFFEKNYDYNKNNNNENTNEIILITSGGTKVSLEHASVRSIENFSTGKRGALIGEYFLLKNKKVIFLYRKGTFKPFEYNLKQLSTLNNFEIKNQNIYFNLNNVDNNLLISDIENFRKYEKNLFCIPFETIFDYAFYLIEICKILHEHVKKGYSKKYTNCQNYKNGELDEIANIPHDENNLCVIQKDEICCNTTPTEQIYDQVYHMLNSLYNLLLSSELENLICSGKLSNDVFFLNVLRQITEFNNKVNDNMIFEKYPEDETNLFTDLKLFINDMLKILNSWLNEKDNVSLKCDISLKEKIYKIIFFMNKISYIVCEKKKNSVNDSHNLNDAIFYPLSQIIILCAAVSDYYIPYNQLSKDKIDSDQKNGLSLNMPLSPKFYKIIYKHFPLLNVCSFKLENNEETLLKKACDRVKYSDILIANVLNYRYKYVYIFKNQKDYYLLKKSDKFENIEYEISQHIYNHFIDKKLWN
ncbi:phosphopantothenoylcysteine synthetase, putative [Plasmodium vinckei]|uniref:Phosphopantothenoylcysteine synthetase, putative n=1 Tax=Plasmodium vinckei TaxID=5860 RepID=A0A6V7SM26_PLAVN|nr:phosphopantothenoylcysteine synthetase, putative [Plasmodium vinckei]